MYVCVRVCAYACVRLNGSESEMGYSLSVQLECPLPAVWWLLGKNCYETTSSLLWYSLGGVVSAPDRSFSIWTGCDWGDGVLENGFYFVPTANCVQGVHGGELCAYDSLCSFDDPLKGLLLLYCCVAIPHSNGPCEDTLHQTSVGMAFSTSFSRHFMATEVSATGRKSFMQVVCGFLGTGMIMDFLKSSGTTAWASVLLKISVYTSASSAAQAFRTLGDTPSGPAALRGLTFCRDLKTCACVTWRLSPMSLDGNAGMVVCWWVSNRA